MRLPRRHPRKIRFIVFIHEGVHTIADQSGERDARGGEFFASHAFYGIAPERGENSDAFRFQTLRLRGEQWTKQRRMQTALR